jgi:heme/copper-type cytochrome/quinol oxidase subunit 3
MSVQAAADVETQDFFGASSNGKIGMWIFLISDAFSFFAAFLGYGMLRAGATVWRHPGEPALAIPPAAGLTLVLILSSVTMALALNAVVARKRGLLNLFVLLTIALGVNYLWFQANEWHNLTSEGLKFSQDNYANSFYLITGFHGAHVVGGIVYLLFILFRGMSGKYDDGNYHEVELADLFWQFVTLAGIFVFAFLYLLPARVGA